MNSRTRLALARVQTVEVVRRVVRRLHEKAARLEANGEAAYAYAFRSAAEHALNCAPGIAAEIASEGEAAAKEAQP